MYRRKREKKKWTPLDSPSHCRYAIDSRLSFAPPRSGAARSKGEGPTQKPKEYYDHNYDHNMTTEKSLRVVFQILQKAYPKLRKARLTITKDVPGAGKDCIGVYREDQKIFISRSLLKDPNEAFATLFHEVAHALTNDFKHKKRWQVRAAKLGVGREEIRFHAKNGNWVT